MRRDHGIFILLLMVVLVLGLAPGVTLADGVDGESTDGEHKEWTDLRPNPMEDKPNPMERPADLSEPAMKQGTILLPAVQQGSAVAFTDTKTQGTAMPAAGSGTSVGFTDAGTQGGSTQAMQPGSTLLPAVQSESGNAVGFTDAGAGQSPGQVQMPGKMR